MNTNTKPKFSNTEAAQQVREMTETGAQQSKKCLKKSVRLRVKRLK